MKKQILLILLCIVFSLPLSAKEADQKFYQEVQPLVEQFVQGVLKEDSANWQKLCSPQEKFLFRYLGHYNTTLTCEELGGLYKEKKKRWWGRQDGSGQPLVGTFQKIWGTRFMDVAKKQDAIAINDFVKSGNMFNKSMDNTSFVDLTWKGSKEYDGMDWLSLRLFFVKKDNQWFLKGLDIYHWTI
ncbi:MAG: hypothetical protein A2W61_04695 [Deltaproteobacteria bacterium RIFCSPLOWO2_01_44_7]|nr:MAG: hypothetical protein A2712_08995 [Deltaproteobacteria bacterium RIFCSPHIGHO2_01_FULL_43_49]OGQ14530.1 MAG: hypothetical protein A3D22_08005 [Deltaproteobacteria bacterium RIFCSPHIGHO2_02_FULL_44_53]OGQ27916.1 MAG: hypothetical protein A3D98_06715 [Deltaproteobacteria bacterium RIFCSPHIGHO2_12_FULL_44_21]OGQ31128.1 MAG: hypothetical protein A2979_06765 [Deltaproteobacteria bacterium RIFCSPLOWO2_01_FULL_45_74]OGQ38222.1 MAG: hypothetical protein A2W61_04695 [Deltaproteobacteria bacterium 